jgi:hypothetical protein
VCFSVPSLSSASDTPHHARIEEFERRARDELDMTVVRWENFQQAFFEPYKHWPHYGTKSNTDKSFIGQVEVIVLAKAAHYIGTGASTFSDHVFTMMPEFGNRKSAINAQIDYDLLTGLNSASYPEDVRPKGFKPAMAPTKHSKEVEERLLAQLPPRN